VKALGPESPCIEAEDNSITLKPDPVEGLEEELIEIGFGVDRQQGPGMNCSAAVNEG